VDVAAEAGLCAVLDSEPVSSPYLIERRVPMFSTTLALAASWQASWDDLTGRDFPSG